MSATKMSGKTFDFLGRFPKRPLQCFGCLWGAISKIVFASGVWVCFNLSYAVTARRVAPAFLKSWADSLKELHILCQCSLAHVPPLCGFTICHIDFLQSHSRFVNPLPHPVKKVNARIAFRTLVFRHFVFFLWRFRASKHSSSVVTVSSSFAHRSSMTSTKRIAIPPPSATPGAPSV